MKRFVKFSFFSFIITIILCTLFTGCGNNSDNTPLNTNNIEPEQFSDVESPYSIFNSENSYDTNDNFQSGQFSDDGSSYSRDMNYGESYIDQQYSYPTTTYPNDNFYNDAINDHYNRKADRMHSTYGQMYDDYEYDYDYDYVP